MSENNNKKNYLEPRKFFDELIKCLIEDRMSESLGEMFYLVASKYVNHRDFVRYFHLKEDLVALGALACCESFQKFKPLKSIAGEWDGVEVVDYHHTTCNNPFAFFTTCIRNKWLQYLKKDYKCKNAVNGLRVKNGLDPDYGYTEMLKDQERAERDARQEEEELLDEIIEENGIEWE